MRVGLLCTLVAAVDAFWGTSMMVRHDCVYVCTWVREHVHVRATGRVPFLCEHNMKRKRERERRREREREGERERDRDRVGVCVCVCVSDRASMYVCVYMCVCPFVLLRVLVIV